MEFFYFICTMYLNFFEFNYSTKNIVELFNYIHVYLIIIFSCYFKIKHRQDNKNFK